MYLKSYFKTCSKTEIVIKVFLYYLLRESAVIRLKMILAFYSVKSFNNKIENFSQCISESYKLFFKKVKKNCKKIWWTEKFFVFFK